MPKLKYPPEVEIARTQRDAQVFHDIVEILKLPAVQLVGGFVAVEWLQQRGAMPNIAGDMVEGALAAPAFAGAINTGFSGLAGGISSLLKTFIK